MLLSPGNPLGIARCVGRASPTATWWSRQSPGPRRARDLTCCRSILLSGGIKFTCIIYIYIHTSHTYKYIYICTYYSIIYIFMFYWGNLRSTINSDTSLVWNLWHFLLKGKPPCVASGESDSSLAVVLAVAFTRKPGSPWIPKPTWPPSTVIGG